MSQFGFFNAPQPQPQAPAIRPGYDVFPASHPSYEPPRRYDDPYARAPSPPRLAPSASSVAMYPPGPMDRVAYPVPMAPLVPQPMAPAHDMRGILDAYNYPSSWRKDLPQDDRLEFFGSTRTDTWRSAAPRRSPPRDRGFAPRRDYSPESRGSTFKGDISPRRDGFTRSDLFRSDFLNNKDHKKPAALTYDQLKRKKEKLEKMYKEKEEERNENRAREQKGRERDSWDRKGRDRDSRESRDKEKEKEKVHKENGEKKKVDDKKDEQRKEVIEVIDVIDDDEIVEKTVDEKENSEENKEVEMVEEDEFEDEYEEVEEKEDDPNKIEKEIEEPVKVDESNGKEDDKISENTEKTEKTDDRQSRIRSPSIEKKKTDPSPAIEKKRNDRSPAIEKRRRDRTRSPSVEKKRRERTRSPSVEKRRRDRARSVEKARKDRSRSRSIERKRNEKRSHSPTIEKKDTGGFKVLKDATFEEIHLFDSRPYDPYPYKLHSKGERSFDNHHHHQHPPSDHPESWRNSNHSGDASWAEQWKAKIMMTKTAVHGFGGAPGPLPPPVIPHVVAPPPAPRPYDLYAARHGGAYIEEAPRLIPPPTHLSTYPPARPPPADVYAYGAPAYATPSRSAYGAPPAARLEPPHYPDPYLHPIGAQEEDWKRKARELYERRLLDEHLAAAGARGRSPPPPPPLSRRELYEREEYERRVAVRRGDEPLLHHPRGEPPREYYDERYRAERPDERERGAPRYYEDEQRMMMRYADDRDIRRYPEERSAPRYAVDDRAPLHSPPYEKMHPERRERSRERRPSYHRDRSRSPPPARVAPAASHPAAAPLAAPHLPSAAAASGATAAVPRPPPIEEIDASKLVEPLEDDAGWDDLARMLSPDKVVVEQKKTKKPLLAGMPPAPLPAPIPPPMVQHHRPVLRDPPPTSFFSQPVPSTRPKIAFADSKPFYQPRAHEEPLPREPREHRTTFFAAPPTAPAPPRHAPIDEAYGRALSYEDLASSNGAAAYRGGPAPGWERGGRGY